MMRRTRRKLKHEREEELEEQESNKELERMEKEVVDDTEDEAEDETEDEEEVEDEQKEYTVEKFVGMKKVGSRYEFKVHWQGFENHEDTWESEKFLREQSGEEVIQLMMEFKAKTLEARARKISTRASKKKNWVYVSDDEFDKEEIPKKDRELGPEDEFFGEKAADAKGEKKRLYDPSHKTSRTELFLAKVGTAERVTRQGIKKLLKGEESAGNAEKPAEKENSRSVTPTVAQKESSSSARSSTEPSSTTASIAPLRTPASSEEPSTSTGIPPRKSGRRNVFSSRGRVLASLAPSRRPVNPETNVAPPPAPASRKITRKRDAGETLDGQNKDDADEMETKDSSETSAPQETTKNSTLCTKSTESASLAAPHPPRGARKRIIMLESYALPRREGVPERTRSPEDNGIQQQQQNEVHEEPLPADQVYEFILDSDDDNDDSAAELLGAETVTVDWDQEMTKTWAKIIAAPTSTSVREIIRTRDPHRFEEAIVSDVNNALGGLLMEKDANGSNVLHEICSAPCDNQHHFSDDLIALILRTASSRRTLLGEKNAQGFTPLHLAVKNGIMCLVKTLLKHKAPLIATDFNGLTPLHLAYEKNHAKMVDTLLMAGANYEQIFKTERAGPRKSRAFARLEKHALKMFSLLQVCRQKTYQGFEEVETVSPIFTLQCGEKAAEFEFRHDAYHMDGKHAYMVMFFVCNIQKENRDEWTARCWNTFPAISLRFKEGFPQLNGERLKAAQKSEDPMCFYGIFGDAIDNRISVVLQEKCPLLLCCQVVLVRIYQPRPVFETPDASTALEYAPLCGPL